MQRNLEGCHSERSEESLPQQQIPGRDASTAKQLRCRESVSTLSMTLCLWMELSLRCDPLRRAQSQEVAVHAGIKGIAQGAVIVVLERDEAEGLQNSVFRFVRRLQDLRHAFHRARCRLDCDLDQIALLQGPGQ